MKDSTKHRVHYHSVEWAMILVFCLPYILLLILILFMKHNGK
jgi:hypothetical protein